MFFFASFAFFAPLRETGSRLERLNTELTEILRVLSVEASKSQRTQRSWYWLRRPALCYLRND